MINAKEYAKMEFNPTNKQNLLVAYPKLTDIVKPQSTKNLKPYNDYDKLLRYVILMYDANSPLRDHYPYLSVRKTNAAELAGYNPSTEDLTSIYDFKLSTEDGVLPNEELLDMVIEYLKYQNNWVWSMIISNEQAFFEYNRRVMMPVDGNRDKDILQAVTIKTQLMQSQDEIYQRLMKYYKELTGGDDELELSITKRKRLRPEEIANNVQQNQ